jgi:hypothetical protein
VLKHFNFKISISIIKEIGCFFLGFCVNHEIKIELDAQEKIKIEIEKERNKIDAIAEFISKGKPGLSNKRFRLWLASRSQSNLIR